MRKAVTLVIVLAVTGVVFGLGSLTVNAQDNGSCPAQPLGTPFTCDHAYSINGTYVWMRPLYIELGITSLVFLASAVGLGLYLEYGRRPSPGTPNSTG